MKILKDEEHILFDHEYDGIQELDNNLPPWWLWLFYLTIGWSAIYFVGYEMFDWFVPQEREYQVELQRQQAREIATRGGGVDSEDLLARGEKIFKTHCATCHGQEAQGTKIAPNLTDDYWLYGKGRLEDIIRTITNGTKKGMPIWGPTLGKKKIELVARYVLSLQGSNPPNAKGPEGKRYKRER